MASALNRTTKQYLSSVNTPDFPLAQWIINPSLAAVAGFESRYWTITGDVVTLMTQGERDAVDAALVSAARDAVTAQLDATEGVLRAFMLVVLDEVNILRTQAGLATRTVNQLRTAIRNKLGT